MVASVNKSWTELVDRKVEDIDKYIQCVNHWQSTNVTEVDETFKGLGNMLGKVKTRSQQDLHNRDVAYKESLAEAKSQLMTLKSNANGIHRYISGNNHWKGKIPIKSCCKPFMY